MASSSWNIGSPSTTSQLASDRLLTAQLHLLGIDRLPAHLQMLPAGDRHRTIMLLRPVSMLWGGNPSENSPSSFMSLPLSPLERKPRACVHQTQDGPRTVYYTTMFEHARCSTAQNVKPVHPTGDVDGCAHACGTIDWCRFFTRGPAGECLAYASCTRAEPMVRSAKPWYRLLTNASVMFESIIQISSLYFPNAYLDVRGSGCNGNLNCTSLANTAQRRSSGQWLLESAAPSSCTGGRVCYGDHVYIRNDASTASYLDVRGANCNGNKRCVSASAKPVSAWVFSPAAGSKALVGSPVRYGDRVHIAAVDEWYCAVLNHNGRNTIFMCTPHLDARGLKCQNNPFCVSASGSSVRDGLSGTWEIEASVCA